MVGVAERSRAAGAWRTDLGQLPLRGPRCRVRPGCGKRLGSSHFESIETVDLPRQARDRQSIGNVENKSGVFLQGSRPLVTFMEWCEKCLRLRCHCRPKMINLPRHARDKHRKYSKRGACFTGDLSARGDAGNSARQAASGAKTPFCSRFYTENDRFTKTGSGQT